MTVFLAAFVAGAAAAVGINRALDVHLAQKRPTVESEPIFVALRSLPQGSPITVWDVALRDWPKAMLPSTAMRAADSFEGCVLRHPLREGQPLLSVQLVRAASQPAAADPATEAAFTPPVPAAPVARAVEADLWSPEPASPGVAAVPAPSSTDVAPPIAAEGEPTLADPVPGEPTLADTPSPAAADVESVVAAKSVTAPATDTPAPAAEPEARSGPTRYLVVPERIALQADVGFQPPAAQTDRRDVPPVREAPATARPRPTATAQQPVPQRAAPPASARSRPPARQSTVPAPQRKPQPTTRQPAAASSRGFGGRFPNLAAGIDAMTGGRRPRAEDEGYDEAIATDGPLQPAQR